MNVSNALRNIAVAVALGGLAVLLSGCPGGVCGCGDPPAAIAAELAYCDLEVAVLDNGGASAVLAEDDEVPRAAIGLELVLRSREELCGAPPWSNPFVSSAYACSCPDFGGFEVSVLDTVTAISILPTTRYSEAYGAGAELAEVFRVETGDREYASIADYLSRAPLQQLVFDGSAFEPPSGEVLRLLSTEPAAVTDALALDVTIQLSDGRSLRATSPQFATR